MCRILALVICALISTPGVAETPGGTPAAASRVSIPQLGGGRFVEVNQQASGNTEGMLLDHSGNDQSENRAIVAPPTSTTNNILGVVDQGRLKTVLDAQTAAASAPAR